MATPQITLLATLDDILGAAAGSTANPAKLQIALCAYGPQPPRVSGTAMLAKVLYTILSAGSPISVTLWGNDQILPAGTFYQITIFDGENNVVQSAAYQFSGTHVYDLSTLTPFNPSPPVPAPSGAVLLNPPGGLAATQTINSNVHILGNLTVDGTINFTFAFSMYTAPIAAGAVLFDGTMGTGMYLVLSANVTSSSASGFGNGGFAIPFVIKQDGTGGRTFVWPTSFKNPPDINPAPNGVTACTWVKAPDGNFYPTGPATWS